MKLFGKGKNLILKLCGLCICGFANYFFQSWVFSTHFREIWPHRFRVTWLLALFSHRFGLKLSFKPLKTGFEREKMNHRCPGAGVFCSEPIVCSLLKYGPIICRVLVRELRPQKVEIPLPEVKQSTTIFFHNFNMSSCWNGCLFGWYLNPPQN